MALAIPRPLKHNTRTTRGGGGTRNDRNSTAAGIVVGVALGLLLDNLALGVAIGVGVGLAIGAGMRNRGGRS